MPRKPKTTNSKKAIKPKKTVSMEAALWAAANNMRGSVSPVDYKNVVLPLIFLKYAGVRYERQCAKIVSEGNEELMSDPVIAPNLFLKDNVFYLTEKCRWSYIVENAKNDKIASIIDDALAEIEKLNKKALGGALPVNYYAKSPMKKANLSSLIDEINKIPIGENDEKDIIGRVYEYFLSRFALLEGKSKGEYYTPKCIVDLICELIQPYKGTIYDPACGSGGMFVQSVKFIESHSGNTQNVSIYGQEKEDSTYKLAKMNLAIRGITADLGERADSTFTDDQHKLRKFDFIMANPPFNLKKWRAKNELTSDPRWAGYKTPSEGNANYAWILHIVSKMSETNGCAAFLLSNGALGGDDATENAIREQLIKNDLVEAIIVLPRDVFYTTDISTTIWVLTKNKKARFCPDSKMKYRDRRGEVLFMDLRQFGAPYEKKFKQLTREEISRVANTLHEWQSVNCKKKYKNIPEYCASATLEDIKNQKYVLAPSRYVKFKERSSTDGYNDRMKVYAKNMQQLLSQDNANKEKLVKVFERLGYGFKL